MHQEKLIFPNIHLMLDVIEALCTNTRIILMIFFLNFMMLHHWLASIKGM